MVPFFITGLQDENKVRAHNEVPRIAGLFKTRLPEEEVCSSAQTDETSVNPVVPTAQPDEEVSARTNKPDFCRIKSAHQYSRASVPADSYIPGFFLL